MKHRLLLMVILIVCGSSYVKVGYAKELIQNKHNSLYGVLTEVIKSTRVNFIKPYLYLPIVTATPSSKVGRE